MVVVYLLIGILLTLFISFAEAVCGMILARFPATRWAGLRLWSVSGLFLQQMPKVCPADRCMHCMNWTCPRFHIEN